MTYTCDLCKTACDRSGVYAFVYTGKYATDGLRANDRYGLDAAQDKADRHLCKHCLRDILDSAPRA